jgi:hypothetical protein
MNELLAILIPLLIQIESSGNPSAIGDSGKAIGVLQIHSSYWSDGCEELKVKWPYKNAFNKEKSILVVKAYLTRYGSSYEKQTKKPITLEILSRIHNGGPSGYKKKSTDSYWLKVQKLLNEKQKSLK